MNLETARTDGHATKIYINTREYMWEDNKITYEQLYEIAFPNQPLLEGDVARIEYSRGANGGGSGALQRGTAVAVKQGMVFDVYVTARS